MNFELLSPNASPGCSQPCSAAHSPKTFKNKKIQKNCGKKSSSEPAFYEIPARQWSKRESWISKHKPPVFGPGRGSAVAHRRSRVTIPPRCPTADVVFLFLAASPCLAQAGLALRPPGPAGHSHHAAGRRGGWDSGNPNSLSKPMLYFSSPVALSINGILLYSALLCA